MYVFFFPLLSSLQSKAAKPSEEGFLRPFGSKRLPCLTTGQGLAVH